MNLSLRAKLIFISFFLLFFMNLSLISIYGKLNVVHCKKVCKVGKALRNMNALKLNHKCLKQPQRALYYGERFIKNYICPFKRSRYHLLWSKSSTVKDTCLFKICWGKKERKTNIPAFLAYTYIHKLTFVIFIFLPFPKERGTFQFQALHLCQK